MQTRYYLTMIGLFSFANALSLIFLNIFLWRLDESYLLLAKYNLTLAVVILISFPLCSWIARLKSPMLTLRLGIISFMFTFGLTLYFQSQLTDHVFLIGISMGIAISLFAIGEHLAILDLTKNFGRDRFLYHVNFVRSLAVMIGPLTGGFLIEAFSGMKGYYVIFALSCLLFLVTILVSFKVKVKAISPKSEMMSVLKKPSKQWKGMLPVMVGEGIVSGAFETFLIALMTFQIAGGERNLGLFQTVSGLIALTASLWLAKISKPSNRLNIYVIGSLMIFMTSGMLTLFPFISSLIIFSIFYPLAKNMIATTTIAWMYAAIEADSLYEKRRLDYIVIREIPLGLGRIIGVIIFLVMREILPVDSLLSYSFIVFPLIFILMIPVLIKVWKPERISSVIRA